MRERKAGLLKAVRPLDAAHVVRGQYAGYQSVPGVKSGSTIETYVAAKLFIDSWRWAGIPIYIRSGKALPVTATEVMVDFKRPPREAFASRENLAHIVAGVFGLDDRPVAKRERSPKTKRCTRRRRCGFIQCD